jgi:hypothetical protein
VGEISLFGVGLQGKSSRVTAQSRINAYAEPVPAGERTRIALYGTPGLEAFVDLGETPWRGLRELPGTFRLFGVHRDSLYEVNNAAVVTRRGTLRSTDGKISMTDNGRQLVMADGTDLYVYDTVTRNFSRVADPDVPPNPTTIDFLDGRILLSEGLSGRFWCTDSYDATSVQPLNFATAESNPDNLQRVTVGGTHAVLFGQYSTEFWVDTGTAGFPFARLPGGTTDYGLAANLSVARFNGTYAFLARQRSGQVQVCVLEGMRAMPISTPELDSLLNTYPDVTTAVGHGDMIGGHNVYRICFPSSGKTWMYDALSGLWSELRGNNGRWRGELQATFLNQSIVSDFENGKLYKLRSDRYDDNGTPSPFEITGRHVVADGNYLTISELELIFDEGLGSATGQGSDPQVMLYLSKDGGHTWGNELRAPLGKIGEYRRRAIFRRLGRSRDWTFRVRITDPVSRILVSARVNPRRGLS